MISIKPSKKYPCHKPPSALVSHGFAWPLHFHGPKCHVWSSSCKRMSSNRSWRGPSTMFAQLSRRNHTEESPGIGDARGIWTFTSDRMPIGVLGSDRKNICVSPFPACNLGYMAEETISNTLTWPLRWLDTKCKRWQLESLANTVCATLVCLTDKWLDCLFTCIHHRQALFRKNSARRRATYINILCNPSSASGTLITHRRKGRIVSSDVCFLGSHSTCCFRKPAQQPVMGKCQESEQPGNQSEPQPECKQKHCSSSPQCGQTLLRRSHDPVGVVLLLKGFESLGNWITPRGLFDRVQFIQDIQGSGNQWEFERIQWWDGKKHWLSDSSWLAKGTSFSIYGVAKPKMPPTGHSQSTNITLEGANSKNSIKEWKTPNKGDDSWRIFFR